MSWLDKLDEREQKQVEFAKLYARDFYHGANGHNDLMIIAKMAALLDRETAASKKSECWELVDFRDLHVRTRLFTTQKDLSDYCARNNILVDDFFVEARKHTITE